MQRIRKVDDRAVVKITLEKTCAVDEVAQTLSGIEGEIIEGFAILATVYEKFDEVRIDKDGGLHCHHNAPVGQPPGK